MNNLDKKIWIFKFWGMKLTSLKNKRRVKGYKQEKNRGSRLKLHETFFKVRNALRNVHRNMRRLGIGW